MTGRGKARRYSLKTAIEFAVFVRLGNAGYKPSAIVPIAAYVTDFARALISKEHESISKHNPKGYVIDFEGLEFLINMAVQDRMQSTDWEKSYKECKSHNQAAVA